MSTDDEKMFIFLRIKHIEKANEANGIELLMVTDELFRFLVHLTQV